MCVCVIRYLTFSGVCCWETSVLRGFVWKTRCSLKPLNICRRVWTEEHFLNKQHNFTLAKVISYSQLNESREPLVGLWKSTSGGTYTLLSFPFFTSSVSPSLKADWTLCFHYQLLIIFWLLFHFRFSEHDFAGKWFTRSASPALSIINPPLQPANSAVETTGRVQDRVSPRRRRAGRTDTSQEMAFSHNHVFPNFNFLICYGQVSFITY